ncbi:MAG: hypothetical protein R3D44_08675 [Hyphomicrobiaceae bacterium]
MKEHASTDRAVWNETYRGHSIATRREKSVWRVAVDGVVQNGVAFESDQEAAAWLRRRVDNRIAEEMFPGLARA